MDSLEKYAKKLEPFQSLTSCVNIHGTFNFADLALHLAHGQVVQTMYKHLASQGLHEDLHDFLLERLGIVQTSHYKPSITNHDDARCNSVRSAQALAGSPTTLRCLICFMRTRTKQMHMYLGPNC